MPHRLSSHIMRLLLPLVLLASSVLATDDYVSSTGSDKNNGALADMAATPLLGR